MPSLKNIRKRIGSVKNTQKITRAMKMVAAARLRRAQENIHMFRPYMQELQRMLADVMQAANDANQQTLDPTAWSREQRPEQTVRVVLFTSDRGLAGAFNSNLYRALEQWLVESPRTRVELEVCGRKGVEYVKRRLRDRARLGVALRAWDPVALFQTHPGVEPKQVGPVMQALAQPLLDSFRSKQVDAVYVLYNQFHNAARQTVQFSRFLPLDLPPAETVVRTSWLYEPTRESVVAQLLPLLLQAQMHRVGLESIASELGARMSAMDNASRNAKEMISNLTLQLNRVRQALITKELMEIIGGAEALQG